MNLYARVATALEASDPAGKCQLTRQVEQEWLQGKLDPGDQLPIQPFDDVGRPVKPELVDPRDLARRSTASEAGRILFLHAFAHIEFNAINIALDAVYRFRQMPRQYVTDWLRVAREESLHFELLHTELQRRGSFYGAFPAHRGLWDMVCKTRHDVLHRMALVPRVMEARGLDVTPSMISKFERQHDQAAVEILNIIYRDEIDHVRIGNHWYGQLCEDRGLRTTETFSALVKQYMGDGLRGPFNHAARLQAGFTEGEMAWLEANQGM